MAKILLADDEKVLFRDGMVAVLKGEGFEVVTARDGIDALNKFAKEKVDLILLDVDMPRMNGFAACEEIRKINATVPIIFLTNKDSEANQVRGLGLGADDYVAKDAGENVILARIHCALDRYQRISALGSSRKLLEFGGAVVDIDRGEVTRPDGKVEKLTVTEVGILVTLASRKDSVVTPDELVVALRGAGFSCEDSMLYSHLSRLRHKLGAAAASVKNIWNVGYRLVR